MFDFLKKILGLPTQDEILAAKAAVAPYKIEPPVINNKTGDIVEPAVIREDLKLKKQKSSQITDAVTQVDKPKRGRKPRAVKAEAPVTEKVKKSKKPVVARRARASK